MDESAQTPKPNEETTPPKSSLSEADSLATPSHLTKKASLRLQKQSYKIEKKKAENEIKMTVNNPAVVILSDWLKVRSTLKNWSRMWCALKPGLLVIYKNSKQKHWVGTVSLASVEIIERPSKKDGFCFKLYHTMDQCIWAAKGPKGETTSFLASSLPSTYLIVRAQSESDGQCWIDALELSKKCSNLLKKNLDNSYVRVANPTASKAIADPALTDAASIGELASEIAELKEKIPMFVGNLPSVDGVNEEKSSDTSETPANNRTSVADTIESIEDSTESCFSDDSSMASPNCEYDAKDLTIYVEQPLEDLSAVGEDCQTETLEGENKSLLWMLLKQVRPGMDLSKVVLPTFILEPRSFLDKLADYYYHVDLLSQTAKCDNAYERMKGVTKWYLSGFYKKPKGLKKPYNPILGETFRCRWLHPDTNSSTYYIAEQVSHHPPVSAFVVSNRKDGYIVSGSILAKSKFYGNSVSAVLEGSAVLDFLSHGEQYCLTMPYAHCKGIIYGKMTMEFGGKVVLACEKTGYSTELEFKLKPMFSGGSTKLNEITGKILLGKRVLATLGGCWDQTVHITDLSQGEVTEFWSVNDDVRKSRLRRHVVDMSQQGDFESEKLWRKVTAAINNQDQVAATEHKTTLENAQRQGAKQRKENGEMWNAKFFEFDPEIQEWVYKYLDARPWDDLNDIDQFESKGIIGTKTRHKTSPLKLISSVGPSTHTLVKKMSFKNYNMEMPSRSSNFSHNSNADYIDHLLQALQPYFENQDRMMKKLNRLDAQLQSMNRSLEERYFPWRLVIVTCVICVVALRVYSYL